MHSALLSTQKMKLVFAATAVAYALSLPYSAFAAELRDGKKANIETFVSMFEDISTLMVRTR